MDPNLKKQITIAELRSNYKQYTQRMKEGEIFCVVDLEDNKHKLYEPLEDGTGMCINIEKIIE